MKKNIDPHARNTGILVALCKSNEGFIIFLEKFKIRNNLVEGM
jgi:hypothetical protein